MQKKIRNARRKFHAVLCEHGIIGKTGDGVPFIADSHNRSSIAIASDMLRGIGGTETTIPARLPGQKAGNLFEAAVSGFLQDTLRNQKWNIKHDGSSTLSDFAQYEHLAELQALSSEFPDLAAAIGYDYMIRPDITTSEMTQTHNKPVLIASISAKLTMRSDRAQNSRTEALNMIRNRKGHLPHIVVVTAEPLPGRIASIALGTGDIDCVYHIALPELQKAVNSKGTDEARNQLETMIKGKRLKDIAELPVDLY